MIDRCVAQYGIDSIKNPNVLEYSLNKAYWDENTYATDFILALNLKEDDQITTDVHLVRTATCTSSMGNNVGKTHTQIQAPTQNPSPFSSKYSKCACLCSPCLKVVTVNIVQSTYTVPTYSTPGGDLRSLNSHCKYCPSVCLFLYLYALLLLLLFIPSPSNSLPLQPPAHVT